MGVVDLDEPRSSLCGGITMCMTQGLVWFIHSFHFNTHEGALILLHKIFNSG